MRKVCKCCVNDSTVKNIKFNKEGLCNFCQTYQKEYDIWHDFAKLEKIFDEKISTIKKERQEGKYQYDVCIPFSGGKDSTYVLYQMMTKYDLKVKTFTLDNGFLSNEAKEKIDTIVKYFNVEHEYITIDDDFKKKIYHYIVGRYLSPCIACSYLGYALMINYASKINAGLTIHGRSRPQMFRNYASDVDDTFKPLLLAGISEEKIDLASLYNQVLSVVDKYIDKKLAQEMKEALLSDASTKGYQEFVGYFLYHDYDMDQVIETIEKNTPWKVQKEKEHFDCLIHNSAKYIKDIVSRRPHAMPEISYLVRDHKITRSEALEMLKNDPISYPKEEMKMMCKYMGLSPKKLMLKARIYSLRWW